MAVEWINKKFNGMMSNVGLIPSNTNIEQFTESYHLMKKKAIDGMNAIKKGICENEEDRMRICSQIDFTRDMMSNIKHFGQYPSNEGKDSDAFKAFDTLLEEFKLTPCSRTGRSMEQREKSKCIGGKFYKLKVKSKNKSKKYKGKKLFRKSKKLVKKVRQMNQMK